MGTWDNGLLDNDTACDGIADLAGMVRDQAMALLSKKPTKARAERIAGGLGLLLQLQPGPYAWTESDDGKAFCAALGVFFANDKARAFVGKGACAVIDSVVGGSCDFEAAAKVPAATAKLLHKSGGSGFGVRHAVLFNSDGAAAVVAQRCRTITAMVNADFDDEDNWSDLCREGIAMGTLGFLLLMTPMTVPATTIARWRKKAQAGIAALEEDADEELEFHRGYYKNLDAVFARLLRRAA